MWGVGTVTETGFYPRIEGPPAQITPTEPFSWGNSLEYCSLDSDWGRGYSTPVECTGHPRLRRVESTKSYLNFEWDPQGTWEDRTKYIVSYQTQKLKGVFIWVSVPKFTFTKETRPFPHSRPLSPLPCPLRRSFSTHSFGRRGHPSTSAQILYLILYRVLIWRSPLVWPCKSVVEDSQ